MTVRMAKDKDRAVNPAAAQRKLEKNRSLRKGKAEVAARRNEKLARRNPERLQRQVDDLRALEESGQIKPREKQILDGLERDVKAIRKARETLGDKAPQFGKQRGEERSDGLLGKRTWEGERKSHRGNHQEQDSGNETDESVRRIPMPNDTPPPIPQQYRRNKSGTNANAEPLIAQRLPQKPVSAPEVKTTYEAAPQIRDLKQEAIKRFIPDVVRKKQEAVRGVGSLVEPEELDRLEREGYVGQNEATFRSKHAGATREETNTAPEAAETAAEAQRLATEEERFQRELRQVQIEEVEDEDG